MHKLSGRLKRREKKKAFALQKIFTYGRKLLKPRVHHFIRWWTDLHQNKVHVYVNLVKVNVRKVKKIHLENGLKYSEPYLFKKCTANQNWTTMYKMCEDYVSYEWKYYDNNKKSIAPKVEPRPCHGV